MRYLFNKKDRTKAAPCFHTILKTSYSSLADYPVLFWVIVRTTFHRHFANKKSATAKFAATPHSIATCIISSVFLDTYPVKRYVAVIATNFKLLLIFLKLRVVSQDVKLSLHELDELYVIFKVLFSFFK